MSNTSSPPILDYCTPPKKIGHFRWVICGLLFLATTINYMDRQALAVMKPTLQNVLQWDEAGYGWMNFAFTAAYAIMFTIAGRFIDVVGTRKAFAIAVVIWSIALMAHSLASSIVGFAIARFILGSGESANFPACIKTVAQWFPQKERALATGIFNSGSNVGIILAPIAVWIATVWHWQASFIIIGGVGLFWVFLWLYLYHPPETHPRLGAAERAYIQEDGASNQVKRLHWTAVLRHKEAWPFLLGKFLTDPVWWFFLFWLPSYLKDTRGLTALSSATWLIVPYVAADIGSIGGGWISSSLIKRGWSVGPARYVAMGICAVCMPASIAAAFSGQFWLALTFISLATAGHQGWSANIFTTASDMFPASLTGSVVGLGGTAGAIGGMLMSLLVGLHLEWTNKYYLPIFIWAGFMHPLSLLLYLLIVGRNMSRADVDRAQDLRANRLLVVGGALASLVGLAGLLLVLVNWEYLVRVAKNTGAAGGATAGIGVFIIGVLLIYAGMPKRPIAKS
jgi:MFS transporter, ACS family, hexuronate transporter